MQCSSCGAVGDGRFCSGCGARMETDSWAGPYWEDDAAPPLPTGPPGAPAPPPPGGRGHRRRLWPIAVLLAVVVLLGGGAALWVLTAPDGRVEADDTSGRSSASSTGDTSSTSAESGTSSETTTPTTTTTTTTTSSSTSRPPDEELEAKHRSALDRLDHDGQWAVTLSAKYDGIRDSQQTTSSGSHVFEEADILELHDDLASAHDSDGSVYLLTSDDIASSAEGDYPDTLWMTVLDPGGLDSRRAAVQWCERAFPDKSGDDLQNVCYPRQLTSP